MTKDISFIIQKVKESKNCNNIDDRMIERIVRQRFTRNNNTKDRIKDTKKILYKIYGAFNKNVNFKKIFQKIEKAYKSDNWEKIKDELKYAMQSHSSSGERIPILEEFYNRIFSITGKPKSILDLGCGLNPLGIVYLGFPKNIKYFAYDIGKKEISFLNKVFRLFGYKKTKADINDLLTEIPRDKTDIALLLKTIPTIEAQEKNKSLEIIEKINSDFVIVSFSTINLGIIKKKKGMKDFYRKEFTEIIRDKKWPIEEINFGIELVFVICKKPNNQTIK